MQNGVAVPVGGHFKDDIKAQNLIGFQKCCRPVQKGSCHSLVRASLRKVSTILHIHLRKAMVVASRNNSPESALQRPALVLTVVPPWLQVFVQNRLQLVVVKHMDI